MEQSARARARTTQMRAYGRDARTRAHPRTWLTCIHNLARAPSPTSAPNWSGYNGGRGGRMEGFAEERGAFQWADARANERALWRRIIRANTSDKKKTGCVTLPVHRWRIWNGDASECASRCYACDESRRATQRSGKFEPLSNRPFGKPLGCVIICLFFRL